MLVHGRIAHPLLTLLDAVLVERLYGLRGHKLSSLASPQALTPTFTMTWETAGDGAFQGFRGLETKPWLVSALEIRFCRKAPFPRLFTLACSVPARLCKPS